MTASVALVLDTTAPTVAWGGITGATAGELLRVGFTLDEPGVTSATLTLADARVLALAVGPPLELLLPPDTPAGLATLRAYVEDDVGNTGTYTRTILLQGTVVVPDPGTPVSTYPTRSSRRRRPQPTTKRIRSRAQAKTLLRTTSASSAASLNAGRAVHRVLVRTAITTSTPPGSTLRTLARTRVGSEAHFASDVAALSRGDGRDLEELLLLELL